MSKIVVFMGSPRKNGFSAQLLSKVIEGATVPGASKGQRAGEAGKRLM